MTVVEKREPVKNCAATCYPVVECTTEYDLLFKLASIVVIVVLVRGVEKRSREWFLRTWCAGKRAVFFPSPIRE